MPGVGEAMREFKKGTLRSGSKSGPVVTDRRQAIAIGMNSVPAPKKRVTSGRMNALRSMRGDK